MAVFTSDIQQGAIKHGWLKTLLFDCNTADVVSVPTGCVPLKKFTALFLCLLASSQLPKKRLVLLLYGFAP